MYIHHLTDFLLQETPFAVLTVLHMAVICYLVWKGPEVIARMGVIAFSFAILFYILVFLASLPEIEIKRLLPMLVQAGLLMYCALKAFNQTFNIKSKRTEKILIVIFSVIVGVLTYLISYDRVLFYITEKQHGSTSLFR